MSRFKIIQEMDKMNESFDGFEVHPNKEYFGEDYESFVEQCEESEAEFYSIYTHNVAGGLWCIMDCETKQDAENMVELLISLIKTAKLVD